LDSVGVLELNSSGGIIGIGNDAVAQNLNIGTGAAARTIAIGNATGATAVVIESGTGHIELTSTGVGNILVDSDNTLLLDSDGVLELNSSGAAIAIGDDANAYAINVGTGAAARTITIGNAASTAVNANALAITLTSVNALSLTDGTATFSLGGTGATSLSAATTVDLDGTGIMSLNSSGAAINIGDDNVSQAINIGNNASSTRTISVGGHVSNTTLTTKGSLTHTGTLTVGVDDTGHNVKLFGASAGSFMLWDEANDTLDIRGATAAGPGKLKLSTGELTVVNGDILGRIDFQAPLEGSSSDSRLVGASIWAEADDAFSGTNNETDIVFATGASATAAEKVRITNIGRFGIGTSANTSAAVNSHLHVCGAGVDYGGENLTAVFQDTSSFAINQGGAIGFSAWRDDNDTDSYAFGAIAGRKEDATTGNEQGYLTLYSRPISTFKDTDLTGGDVGKLQEVIRITSARNVGIGTQSPNANLEIKGTLSFPLPDTTSTSSGTGNKTIASTNHALEVGDSVGLPSGSSELIERFTVASVTDANVFVVDSNLTGAITNKLGYKDHNLLSIRNADNVKLITVDSSGRLGIGTSTPGSYANPAPLTSYSDTNNYKAVFDTDGDIHTYVILDAGNGGTNRNATTIFRQDGAAAWSSGMYALDYKIQNDAAGGVYPFVILNGADDGAFKIDADGNTLIKGYALSNTESYSVSIKPVNSTNHLTMGQADKQNNYSMLGIFSAAAAGISGVTADGDFDDW